MPMRVVNYDGPFVTPKVFELTCKLVRITDEVNRLGVGDEKVARDETLVDEFGDNVIEAGTVKTDYKAGRCVTKLHMLLEVLEHLENDLKSVNALGEASKTIKRLFLRIQKADDLGDSLDSLLIIDLSLASGPLGYPIRCIAIRDVLLGKPTLEGRCHPKLDKFLNRLIGRVPGPVQVTEFAQLVERGRKILHQILQDLGGVVATVEQSMRNFLAVLFVFPAI